MFSAIKTGAISGAKLFFTGAVVAAGASLGVGIMSKLGEVLTNGTGQLKAKVEARKSRAQQEATLQAS